ncbi:MAG: hypothetical protein Q4G61_10585 [Tissierellia bacterium]|nr:hypothetical protein [Tissierellia bacterium]
MEFHNGPIYDGEHEIKIVIPKAYPDDLIHIFLSNIPDKMEHIYNDKSICMATISEQVIYLQERPSLGQYLEKFLDPFIYSIEYFREYGIYPFGERAHGYKGSMSYFMEEWSLTKNQIVELFIIVSKNKYRGHRFCFCGSGEITRNCHGAKLLPILKNSQLHEYFLQDLFRIVDGVCDEKK